MTLLYLSARVMATNLPVSETGASWKNKCGAAVNTLGERAQPGWQPRVVGPSANKNVRPASKILFTDPAAAPAGAQHWWAGGANNDGHVATDLLGGGHTLFMASSTLAETWQPYLGVNSAAAYTKRHRELTYLGWSADYAGATYSSATRPIDWLGWQQQLHAGGYYKAAVDGIPGPKTLAALMHYLHDHYGYAGALDGKPGNLTMAAFLRADAAGQPATPAPAPAEPPTIPDLPAEPAPDPIQEEPMPTKPALTAPNVPALPDVIIPARGRNIMYLVNWLAGVGISALVAGWLATSVAPPTWLLVTVAVYSSASSSVALIAKANVPK